MDGNDTRIEADVKIKDYVDAQLACVQDQIQSESIRLHELSDLHFNSNRAVIDTAIDKITTRIEAIAATQDSLKVLVSNTTTRDDLDRKLKPIIDDIIKLKASVENTAGRWWSISLGGILVITLLAIFVDILLHFIRTGTP